MKGIVGILPWALVLAAIGGAIRWLLSGGMAAGPWLLAALLVGHGVVHAMFAVPSPAAPERGSGPEWPFDMAASWAITRLGADPHRVRVIGMALVAIVVAGFALAALCTVGILIPPGWWPAIVAASAVASGMLLALFFEPQLVLGLAIDAVLLLVVATGSWLP